MRLNAETQPGMNEASCLAGMINISALYDVVMWATACECVVVTPSETSVGNPERCHDRWRHNYWSARRSLPVRLADV